MHTQQCVTPCRAVGVTPCTMVLKTRVTCVCNSSGCNVIVGVCVTCTMVHCTMVHVPCVSCSRLSSGARIGAPMVQGGRVCGRVLQRTLLREGGLTPPLDPRRSLYTRGCKLAGLAASQNSPLHVAHMAASILTQPPCRGRGSCLTQMSCCPVCDTSAVEHGDAEDSDSDAMVPTLGPNLPCANVSHQFGVSGPNWPGGGYYTLWGWCGKAECEPVYCPNNEICSSMDGGLPQWFLDCHGSRCLNCNMTFGKDLTFRHTPDECPVCLECDTKHVDMPFCSHSVCVACFKRMYVFDTTVQGEMDRALKCPICRTVAPPSPWAIRPAP